MGEGANAAVGGVGAMCGGSSTNNGYWDSAGGGRVSGWARRRAWCRGVSLSATVLVHGCCGRVGAARGKRGDPEEE